MILYSQFSVVLPLQAFHHAICEYHNRNFFDSMLEQQWWRTGHVQKKLLTGSSRGVMVPGSVSGGCRGIHRWCGRYPVSIDQSAEEGIKQHKF